VTLTVEVEESAGFVESGFVVNAGENVLQVAAVFSGAGDTVSSEQGEAEAAGKVDE
jgi:hypothetical protein